MRAKAIAREKRVQWTEFLDMRLEKAVLKLEKDPRALGMFCDRALPRIQKKIEELQARQKTSFKETAIANKEMLAELTKLREKARGEGRRKLGLPPAGKLMHLWTKAERANYSMQARKIKGYAKWSKKIKEEQVIENKIRGLKAEITWLEELKKGAH